MSASPRWQQLAEQLEQEIRTGRRAPGSKLPSLAEWRADGLSQTTTLRAYRELTARGLAVSVHGSGTYVAEVIPAAGAVSTLDGHEQRLRAIEERLARLENRR